MNPLLVESALQTALSAEAFSSIPVYTGTDYQELTPESLNLIVSVVHLEHTLGPLYKAHVEIRVASPALLGSAQLSSLSSTLENLRTTVLSNAYLGTYWPGGIPGFAGIWIQETAMSQQEHQWVAVVKVLVGVSE